MSQCFPLAQGRRLRVTELDSCGRPVTDDPCASVTTSGFVQVSASSTTETGTSIAPLNANGDLCFQIRSPDIFLRHELTLQFCEVNPDLMNFVTFSRPVLDYDSEAVGFRTRQGAAENGYALEVWMGVPGQECPEDAEASLGYVLFPWIRPGALGNFTLGNAEVTFEVGGFTQGGAGWGVGPYDVVPQDGAQTPGPLLEAIQSDVHAHFQYTTIAAPDPFCGCSPLS